MTRPTNRIAAVVAGGTLILAVSATVVGFALRTSAQPPGMPLGAAQGEFADRMDDAHAAAGIATSSLSAVQGSFHRNLEEAKARLAETPEDRELVLEVARLLHDGHRPDEAVEYYQRAVDLDPTQSQAHYDLAQAHVDRGSWDDAASALRARLNIDPGDGVALYDLGAVLANAGDLPGARAAWTQLSSSASDPMLRERAEDGIRRIGAVGAP